MTREDIIRMVQQMNTDVGIQWTKEDKEKFAALVAAAEREACAMEAEYEAARWTYAPEAREPCESIVKAIRARERDD